MAKTSVLSPEDLGPLGDIHIISALEDVWKRTVERVGRTEGGTADETPVTRAKSDSKPSHPEAERVGIEWERPKDDKRSAQEIINDSPLLKNLGNQSGVKDMLKDRVGDFEKDADAAYRAVQVLEHVEKFDENGKVIVGKDKGNGQINGFTKGGDARHGTEAGRLQDFGKYGFDNLHGVLRKPEKVKDNTAERKQAESLGIEWERPKGDKRSARAIINDSPLLKNLGNQGGVKNLLKDRVGDFEKDADAAYRAVQVLEHVEKFDENGKVIVGKDMGNGKINGFTKGGDARHGTEAGRLQDFGKYGFGNLKGVATNRDEVKNNTAERKRAESLGIEWERPKGDKRSARAIINDSPLLKNLGNQSGVKDRLKDRVGDFEKDADAAYRAVQVLEHVEKFDENGKVIVGKDKGNGKINGFTKGGDARHGTEAGRLQDFGKYGFGNLKGVATNRDEVKNNTAERKRAESLGIEWERPKGDKRSARTIINDSPLLKNLGNQSGVKDSLKDQVGDFEKDADAAYRAVQVLDHVEKLDGSGNRLASKDVGDGQIDGFTKSGEAKPNTEAGRLQDFGKFGFAALDGELTDISTVGNNKAARKEAESKGIMWELPKDDDRSVKDIINDNPLLKNLGNQSGVKDMLKERVGDFEKDADAAFRASQVVDRVSMFDADGNVYVGSNVFNGRIDGFTKSGEAVHGTEAGRLQDFGKLGFSALSDLPKAGSGSLYREYEKDNPDADDASKTIAKYGSILFENFSFILSKAGGSKYITVDDIKNYIHNNPQLGDDLKEGLTFWTQSGAFEVMDTAKDNLRLSTDGLMGAKDILGFMRDAAPKTAEEAMAFVSDVAQRTAVADTDTASFTKDMFVNPDKYSTEDKAAALKELMQAEQLIVEGMAAGMWKNDGSIVGIANRLRSHPDPKKLLQDVQDHIGMLQSDPEVADYLFGKTESSIKTMMENAPELKESIQSTYDDKIKSGDLLNDIWDENAKSDDPSQLSVLTQFVTQAQAYQGVLGMEAGEGTTGDIQQAIDNSAHTGEFEDYYKNSLVSADRLNELMEDHSFEDASNIFNTEVAIYNISLNKDFTEEFDIELSTNYGAIAEKQFLKDSSFDDLKTAFGVDGGEELDEEKLLGLVETISEENPDFFMGSDGTVISPDKIVAGFRGVWDVLRQGTKALNEFDSFKEALKDSGFAKANKMGAFHGVSGLLMAGVTIARGINAGSNPTDKQIVDITTGAVQTAGLLIEGGTKGYNYYLSTFPPKEGLTEVEKKKDKEKIKKRMGNVSKFERAAKGIGGITNVIVGAYSIYDGVVALRNGKKLEGGLNITAGALGILAGGASVVEAGAATFVALGGKLGAGVSRAIAIAAGVTGIVAAIFAAIATVVPFLVDEIKQEARTADFAKVLGNLLIKYEIDGVKDGETIPDDAWPDAGEGLS